MPTFVQSAFDRLLREIADRYIRQGYPVQIQPIPADLPDFLKGYRPDLIVTTPEGKIVIEVKGQGKARDSSYWEGLTRAIEAQPGWRFQFLMDNRRESELIGAEQPVLSREEMEVRLVASQQLADTGLLDSALLVAWSAVEAILRAASREEGLKLPNQGPGPLITALYMDADLEREDYDALMRILQVRNQAAHGFRATELECSLIDEAQRIARRLIEQDHREA